MNYKHPIFAFLVGCLGYFALAQLGLAINNIHLHVAAIWPASGFAFLWYSFAGLPALVGVAVGSYIINYSIDLSALLSLGIAIGTCLEIYLAHDISQRFISNTKQTGLHQRITKIFTAFFAPSLVAATCGVLSLYFDGKVELANTPFAFLTWTIGDGLGLVFFVPFFRSLQTWSLTTQNRWRDIGLFLILTLVAICCGYFLSIHTINDYFIFLFLFLILSVSRLYGPTHAYFLALGYYAIRILLTRTGIGFPPGTPLQFNLIHLQIHMASIALTLIIAEDFSRYRLSRRPLWVMAIAWFISSFAYTIALHYQSNTTLADYQEHIAQENAKLNSRIAVYSSAIRTMAAHVGSKKNRCNPDWGVFVESAGLLTDYPGLNGVGIIFAVPRSHLKQWHQEYQKTCKTNFDVRPLPQADNFNTQEAFVAVNTVPESINKIVIGYDIATETKRYNAAIHARDTKNIAITAPIQLASANHKKLSFLFLAPVLGVDGFLGWVHAPVVWDNFMKHTIDDLSAGYYYRIWDGDQILYQNFETPPQNPFVSNDTFIVADKKLRIEWLVDTLMIGYHNWVSVWISFLMTGISLLLAIVVGNLELLTIQANEIAEHKSAALVSAAKMAGIGELSSNIAHEINNPLGIILGTLEVLRLKKTDHNLTGEALDESHERIRNTTLRMGRIVHGMQVLSKDASRVPRRALTLTEPIEVCLDLVREKFKEQRIDLRMHLSAEAVVMGNETEISQVVTNLLNNAFDAIKKTDNPWIEIQTSRVGEQVFLIITDSGPGLAPEIAEKIMTPWFTTKNYNQGSGLGLSISLRIMQAHKGTLKLDRQHPHTRFVATFPV